MVQTQAGSNTGRFKHKPVQTQAASNTQLTYY